MINGYEEIEKTLIVNNDEDFIEYILIMGWGEHHSGLIWMLEQQVEYAGCENSYELAIENYYQTILLYDEEEQFVKFNIPKERILFLLEEVLRSENFIPLVFKS